MFKKGYEITFSDDARNRINTLSLMEIRLKQWVEHIAGVLLGVTAEGIEAQAQGVVTEAAGKISQLAYWCGIFAVIAGRGRGR